MNSQTDPALRHYLGGALIALGISTLLATLLSIFVDFKTAPPLIAMAVSSLPYICGGVAAGFLVVKKAIHHFMMVGLNIGLSSLIAILIPNIIILQNPLEGLRVLLALLLGVYLGMLLRVKILKT